MFPSIKQLHNIFFNELECINYLFSKGILDSPTNCEACTFVLKKLTDRFRCTNKQCKRSFSIFKGSFFSRCKLKCNEIMLLLYLFLSNTSCSSIQLISGHSSATIAEYHRFYLQLIENNVENEDMKIGGNGIKVQIDETKLGKRKYHRGHRVDGVWVLVGVEITNERKLFIKAVSDRCAQTLEEIITSYVYPGSIIQTDMWKGYNNLNRLGYIHERVNHSIGFINEETGVNTNTVEGTNNGLKLSIPARNRVECGINGHLLKFVWRRKNKDDLWNGLLNSLKNILYVN